MARSGNKPGFTLIELLLVLVILATIAALSTPALKGFTKSRLLPNTAQELVNTARWCHMSAIMEGLTYRLNFDAQDNSWFVTRDDGTLLNFTPVETNFIPVKYSLPEGMTLDTNIPAAAEGVYISFDPGGRSELGTITLESERISVTITCDTPRGSYYVVKPATGG